MYVFARFSGGGVTILITFVDVETEEASERPKSEAQRVGYVDDAIGFVTSFYLVEANGNTCSSPSPSVFPFTFLTFMHRTSKQACIPGLLLRMHW